MASKKLQIVDNNLSLNFWVRWENLAKAKKPEIVAKAANGKEVKQKTVYAPNNQVITKGEMKRQWLDDDGVQYGESELTFYSDNEPIERNSMTTLMEIEGYQPLSFYTDKYIIGTYYELGPHNNDKKKDIDRAIATKTNLFHMKKLWDYLMKENKVARGEFCPASRGFEISDAYIRAIKKEEVTPNGVEEVWGFELGVFKEEKQFLHLNKGTPQMVKAPATQSKKRIKRI